MGVNNTAMFKKQFGGRGGGDLTKHNLKCKVEFQIRLIFSKINPSVCKTCSENELVFGDYILIIYTKLSAFYVCSSNLSVSLRHLKLF